jgi:soluble lytic murein transglycosylase-like protein
LLSAGYSASEIVDILTGRLRQGEIDRARRLVMAGYGTQHAADYLEAAVVRRGGPTSAPPEPRRGTRMTDMAAARGRAGDPSPAAQSGASGLNASLKGLIRRYATHYGVDPALVHAMVDTESRGDADAVSSRGARGLMQLMPATARMLGVNPRDPADNLRGGIAYFAGLVRQFGDVPSALVAYNAGPTHAERVRRGDAVLYGESRRYLERIASLTGMTSYLPGTTGASGSAIAR